MEVQMSFFEQNDKQVCARLSKILLWITLVFPALFILSAVGVFQIKFRDLGILSIPGCICTIGPTILQKIGISVGKMKYISVLAVGFVVMLLGGNSAIGIYMTYGLAMLFSCMFFDQKFTLRIAVISYFFLIISLYLRSLNVMQIEYPTNMEWFLTRSVGFTIEQVVMGVVFVSIAKASRALLENLHSANQVKEVVETCGKVSSELVSMTKELAELLGQIEQDYHRENTAEGLLKNLEALLLQMRKQRLPRSREEFEARAILFYILMQIRNLLELKREFWKNRF